MNAEFRLSSKSRPSYSLNVCYSPRHWSAAPARRLWSFLVRQEPVQELFIRCVFGKRRCAPSIADTDLASTRPPDSQNLPEPVRIIHKEQDSITAFCLNQVRLGYMSKCHKKVEPVCPTRPLSYNQRSNKRPFPGCNKTHNTDICDIQYRSLLKLAITIVGLHEKVQYCCINICKIYTSGKLLECT